MSISIQTQANIAFFSSSYSDVAVYYLKIYS